VVDLYSECVFGPNFRISLRYIPSHHTIKVTLIVKNKEEDMTNKFLFSMGTVVLSSVLISACSQQSQNEEVMVAADPVAAVGVAHTHPANECTNSISHTHPNGGNAHKHHYSCNPNKRAMGANAHIHPANKCTRSISHSHPNGKGTHKHHYSCQSKGPRVNPNAHVHPANSLTRSVRHTHPNGANKHNHHYGR